MRKRVSLGGMFRRRNSAGTTSAQEVKNARDRLAHQHHIFNAQAEMRGEMEQRFAAEHNKLLVALETADGQHKSVSLSVEVFGFALPTVFKLRTAIDFDRKKLSAVYDNAFNVPGRKSRSPAWIANMTRVYEDWMLRELRFNPGNICEYSRNGCSSHLSMWSLTQPLLRTDGSDGVSVERLSAQHELGLNAFNVPLPWKTKLAAALQNISAPGGYLDQLEEAGLLQFASTCKRKDIAQSRL